MKASSGSEITVVRTNAPATTAVIANENATSRRRPPASVQGQSAQSENTIAYSSARFAPSHASASDPAQAIVRWLQPANANNSPAASLFDRGAASRASPRATATSTSRASRKSVAGSHTVGA